MKLVIASLNYSSWSVRAWLALKHAGVEFGTFEIPLKTADDWQDQIRQFSGAAKVPVLVDGPSSIHESLAICEYAHELRPDAGLWPTDSRLRARARAISCEMHAGFPCVRDEMPMNTRARTTHYVPSEAARREIARIHEIWNACLDSSGGPFLFGDFGIADCMYAPVISRFRSYGVPFEGQAALDYADAMWEQPAVAEWLELAATATAIPVYDAAMA